MFSVSVMVVAVIFPVFTFPEFTLAVVVKLAVIYNAPELSVVSSPAAPK